MRHHEVPLHRSWGILSGNKAGLSTPRSKQTLTEKEKAHGSTLTGLPDGNVGAVICSGGGTCSHIPEVSL